MDELVRAQEKKKKKKESGAKEPQQLAYMGLQSQKSLLIVKLQT